MEKLALRMMCGVIVFVALFICAEIAWAIARAVIASAG